MNHENLRLSRNILFRSFLIGMGITAFLALLTFAFFDVWMNWASLLLRLEESKISSMLLTFFTEIRFFLLYLLLTPALAIHWTLKAEEESKKGKDAPNLTIIQAQGASQN
ncbi:MAG: hypothetical protein K2X27_17760 [Candidatus Obscuribacterales bacterium]|nr:hypothetical protein [Candidatus Obscuribacterales bacterium]